MMKKLVVLILGWVLVLAGCEVERYDINPSVCIYGEWELLNADDLVAGGLSGKQGDGVRERYVFYKDGTFGKWRTSAAGSTQARGNFILDWEGGTGDTAYVKNRVCYGGFEPVWRL